MKQRAATFVRFLFAGALNTAVTYGLFIALAKVLQYLVAYTVAYVSGIVLSYLLNTHLVFRTRATWRSAAAFPFVYLVQYLWGVALLFVLVSVLGWRSEIAMLVVIASSVVLTYALIERLLRAHRHREASAETPWRSRDAR